MAATSSWTSLEIDDKSKDIFTNATKFKILLRYVYIHTSGSTPSFEDVKTALKTVHKNNIYPIMGDTPVSTERPWREGHIYLSPTSDLPDAQIEEIIVSESVLSGFVTRTSTVANLVSKLSSFVPNVDGSLYMFIVQNMNLNGVPIPLLDTHSETASAMISRFGFVSSQTLNISGIENPYPSFNSGYKTILHALGHMLGLPHPFKHEDCGATFTDSLNTNYSGRTLSRVHDELYADKQKYDNMFVTLDANGQVEGTNSFRISNLIGTKPLDMFTNFQNAAFDYTCVSKTAPLREGAKRMMDVSPDDVRLGFTNDNVVLMRRNLMNYDKSKSVSGASGIFGVTLEKGTTGRVPDTKCDNDACKPPKPTTPPPGTNTGLTTVKTSSKLSVGAIIGIVLGVLAFLLIVGYFGYRYRKNKMKPKTPLLPATKGVVPAANVAPELYQGPAANLEILKPMEPLAKPDPKAKPVEGERIDWDNI